MYQDKTGEFVDTSAQASVYTGALTSVYFGWFTVNEWAAIIGAFVAVLGLMVHVWYTLQKNRRAEEAHRANLEGKVANTKNIEGETAGDAESMA